MSKDGLSPLEREIVNRSLIARLIKNKFNEEVEENTVNLADYVVLISSTSDFIYYNCSLRKETALEIAFSMYAGLLAHIIRNVDKDYEGTLEILQEEYVTHPKYETLMSQALDDDGRYIDVDDDYGEYGDDEDDEDDEDEGEEDDEDE